MKLYRDIDIFHPGRRPEADFAERQGIDFSFAFRDLGRLRQRLPERGNLAAALRPTNETSTAETAGAAQRRQTARPAPVTGLASPPRWRR